MNDKINNLIKKFLNKETISYLIFGVLTTIINIELAFIMSEDAASLVGNVIAWVISVAFAFVTNKLFVFESKSMAFKVVMAELTGFVIARLLSLAFDEGFMFVAIVLLGMNSLLAKIISNVFVVIINYVLSKFFIFKNK